MPQQQQIDSTILIVFKIEPEVDEPLCPVIISNNKISKIEKLQSLVNEVKYMCVQLSSLSVEAMHLIEPQIYDIIVKHFLQRR